MKDSKEYTNLKKEYLSLVKKTTHLLTLPNTERLDYDYMPDPKGKIPQPTEFDHNYINHAIAGLHGAFQIATAGILNIQTVCDIEMNMTYVKFALMSDYTDSKDDQLKKKTLQEAARGIAGMYMSGANKYAKTFAKLIASTSVLAVKINTMGDSKND